MISEAFYSKLAATTALTDKVSLRIYPVRLPQNPVFPCVTFQVISEPRVHSLDGCSAPNVMIQVDCWSKGHKSAHEVAEAVMAAFDSFAGTMGSHYVSGCLLQNRQEIYEPDVDDYRVSLDFSLWYN